MVKKLLGSHPNEPLHFGVQLFLFNHKCFYIIISGANRSTSLNRTAVLGLILANKVIILKRRLKTKIE